MAAADNGGRDGWGLLDRVIAHAPSYLRPGGRLVFTLFGFLGVKAALRKLAVRVDIEAQPPKLGPLIEAINSALSDRRPLGKS